VGEHQQLPPQDERRTTFKIAPLAAAATNRACQQQRPSESLTVKGQSFPDDWLPSR
jgi:hypothetical protein